VVGYRVVFRPEALRDLAGIDRYISERAGDRIASAFLDRIEARLRRLADAPHVGTRYDDIHPGLRRFGFERRISILTIVGDGVVEIVGVLYGGRDLERVLDDRLRSS